MPIRAGKAGGAAVRPRQRRGRTAQLAAEVWGAMVHAVWARRDHMINVASKFELTLPQAKLLPLLQHGPARTMTSIAEALGCDASNITGIVDRLEARGFIARGHAKHDRRIKSIVLTKHGRQVVNELMHGFLEPPEGLRRLSEQQLGVLRDILLAALGRWQEDFRGAAKAK